MVTTQAGFVVDLNGEDGDPDRQGTTAVGIRRAMAVLLQQSSPGVPLPGRFGAGSFVVTGSPSSMVYNVSGGGIVLVRTSTNGAYLVGVPLSLEVPTAPSDGVNPRIDRIYALQPDPAIDGFAVGVDFIVDVASGTPGGTPTAPSIPPGALELARKIVGPGVTNTAEGAAFTNVAPVTGINSEGLALATHAHSAGDITSGTLPLARGGTGASNKSTARTNLGFLTGTSAPANSLGDDGDLYFQRL